MMIDNLVSARVVTAEGKLITVSETENIDLFWALRGAGQRFGLVTQVTLKTYDVTSLGSSDGSIWNGTLVWEEHQLEQLTEVIDTLKWDRHTAYFGFVCAPPAFKVNKLYPMAAGLLVTVVAHYYNLLGFLWHRRRSRSISRATSLSWTIVETVSAYPIQPYKHTPRAPAGARWIQVAVFCWCSDAQAKGTSKHL